MTITEHLFVYTFFHLHNFLSLDPSTSTQNAPVL